MIIFLTVDQVIKIHDTALIYGGLRGIRDKNSLISAVETPKSTMFGEFLHKTMYDKAAAYLFHIVQNHPFNDGNKRTGALSAALFLQENKAKVNYLDEDYEELVILVAQGKADKEEIAKFFQTGIVKVNRYRQAFQNVERR